LTLETREAADALKRLTRLMSRVRVVWMSLMPECVLRRPGPGLSRRGAYAFLIFFAIHMAVINTKRTLPLEDARPLHGRHGQRVNNESTNLLWRKKFSPLASLVPAGAPFQFYTK
jgi:hypothetical protein